MCVCVKESIADCQSVLSQKKISAAEREIAFSFAFKALNYPHQEALWVSQGDTLLSKCVLSWMYQFVCFVHTCMIFLFQRCSVDSIVTLNSKWPYSTVYYRDENYVNTYPQIMLAIVSLHQ